ncbi:MAG: NAD(P)H-hydrate epimerase [Planctomycetota bacterium]
MFFDRRQSRLVDEIAIERFGIPGIVLMENAGRSCANYLIEKTNGPVLVCCGTGNNGGDGFVIARHLENAGRNCSIVLSGPEEKLAADAAVNFKIVKAMRLPVAKVDPDTGASVIESAMTVDGDDPVVIVDALLGTGAKGALRRPMDLIVDIANRMPAVKIAIDIPSGLDCDNGSVSEPAFRAHATLTFVTQKTGFKSETARQFTGAVHVMDIGVPADVVDQVAAS